MKNYLRLLRPKHYIKNIFVLLPLVFSGQLFDRVPLISAICGFAAFCLLSSVIYIINDIRDAERDRLHPTKSARPIASGAISRSHALILAAALSVCTAIIGIIAGFPLCGWLCLGIYLIVNLAYSFGLKDVPILDIVLLVSGFLLRVIFGGFVTGIAISDWLILTVVSVAFYLALGKRRGELRQQSGDLRKVLKYYNDGFLNRNMHVCLTLAIVFYSLWSVDTPQAAEHLVWTVPLVICMGLKYGLTIEGNSDGDPVEVIFQDKILMAMIAVFAAITLALLYIF